jgi:glycosyltransferase involved in cell wall biosynthesis
MRLALITHKLIKGDGQGRVNYELARETLAAGHTVFLLASEVEAELAEHPLARVVRIGVAGLPTALLKNQVFACRTAVWIWRHRSEIDLVHANGFVSWCAADINSSHFVHAAWVRSRYHTWRIRRDLYGFYQLIYNLAGKWLEHWSYRHSRRVVAVSEQVRRELLEAGVTPERLRVIPNGVDTDEFAPREVSRSALGLPEGKLVLFIGDIRTPRKNLDTLLRAMVNVSDATLVVVGSTARSPYPRLAVALGLEARVAFLGFRRDVPQLMRAADIFVFPSRYEACSLVLLEAAASGLPIVAAAAAGGTELLTPECSELLQDSDDAVALAASLNRLLEAPEVLRRMGMESRRVALANSWQAMARRYLELYCELMQQPARQAQDAAPRQASI